MVAAWLEIVVGVLFIRVLGMTRRLVFPAGPDAINPMSWRCDCA